MDGQDKPGPSWFEKLLNRFTHEPEDRDELVSQLHAAFEKNLLDADALTMIEGVLSFSEMTACQVMIPRCQMDVIKQDESIPEALPFIIETAHSRFPVIGEDKDDIKGILLAKDLLGYFLHPERFHLADLIRPAVYVPESKPLNQLLSEFRTTRNHMAIVVDEYGSVAGLVTVEDVIEQIVGDIEDEFDLDDEEDDIVPIRGGRFRVRASTEINDLNQYFGTDFDRDEAETLGGLILNALGHMPKRGETLALGSLNFTILKADDRRLQSILVSTESNT